MNKILFVKGAKNSCILDLRQKYALIYHIEFEEKDAFTLPKVPTGIFIIFEKDYETFCLSKDSNNSFAKLIEKLQPLNKLDDNVISPKFAWIEITEKCNYHCIHCYGSYLSKGQNISKELFERAVDYVKSLNINRLQLIGGEPLLHPCLFTHLLPYVKKIGFKKVEIFTNGSLINQKSAEKLKEFGVDLRISVYSHEDSINDRITNFNNSLNTLSSSLCAIKSVGLPFMLFSVLTSFNDDFSEEKTTKRLNVNCRIRTDIARMVGRGRNNCLSDKLISKAQIGPQKFTKKILSENILSNLYKHNCFSSKIFISVNGEIYPCVMERGVAYGNLVSDSSESIILKWKECAKLTKNNIQVCEDCEYRLICFDCRPNRGKANFLSKPWNCSYNPYVGMFPKATKELI